MGLTGLAMCPLAEWARETCWETCRIYILARLALNTVCAAVNLLKFAGRALHAVLACAGVVRGMTVLAFCAKFAFSCAERICKLSSRAVQTVWFRLMRLVLAMIALATQARMTKRARTAATMTLLRFAQCRTCGTTETLRVANEARTRLSTSATCDAALIPLAPL